MGKKTVVIGLCVALCLIFSLFPSVVAYNQLSMQPRHIFEKTGENTLQTHNTIWQPGMFIQLFLLLMIAVREAIAQGNWVPGMISGAFILYLVLIWFVIFGQKNTT